jgi:hypothetical protein
MPCNLLIYEGMTTVSVELSVFSVTGTVNISTYMQLLHLPEQRRNTFHLWLNMLPEPFHYP